MPPAVPVPSVSAVEADARASADAEPPIGLWVEVVHEAGDWPQLPSLVAATHAAAAAVAAELGVTGRSACVALSSDVEVAKLNAAYRGKPAPTNVLSFAAGETPPGTKAQGPFLGDIGLAAETVAREAEEQGLPLVEHLQHLVVHGLLHLLGYDHQTDAEADVMEALEVRTLARLGVADPYAESDASKP